MQNVCGKERNSLSAPINRPHFKNSVCGEKAVRLKSGVKHADVQQIRGRIVLLLPVSTETVQLASLDQEHTVDREGLRITLQRSAADTLDYKVYGDSRRLLTLRGLNANAQPLSRSSSMSNGYLFGEGLSKNQTFEGQVVSAELVLALRDVEKSFPFVLVQTRPRNSQNESKHDPVSVSPYSLAQLHREFKNAPSSPDDNSDVKDEVVSGPFRITLKSMRSFIGLNTGFNVYAPAIPGLAENLGGMALEVTAIENAHGENLIEGQAQIDTISLNVDWQDKSRLQGQVNLGFETRTDVADMPGRDTPSSASIQRRRNWLACSEILERPGSDSRYR